LCAAAPRGFEPQRRPQPPAPHPGELLQPGSAACRRAVRRKISPAASCRAPP